ncbi:MAG TPA: 23S rRNA (adenine(2503)-C(2))-methyltransferase RlmN [Candidatus Brocadiia bacterium]|nr:23S rRNA (adenine(2503)-C(2))-methyltransferase RlmN [Candidatus Brocadiales bacterium]
MFVESIFNQKITMRHEALSITNMSLSEIEEICVSLNEERYHARQICSWIYKHGAYSFEEMTNIPKSLRSLLHEKYSLFQSKIETVVKDVDGTEKFLIHLHDDNIIESVLIRDKQRITACLSSQVGCASACGFCASGLHGLVRNLQAGEIVEQLVHMKNSLPGGESVSNVVLMGIGEPLANYDNVLKAIRIINADWGLGIGARKITVSTIGLIKGIKRLATEGLQVNLSISLHAPNDIIRNLIVPINKGTGIRNILLASHEYFEKTGREVTFEYLLIDGVNSSTENAKELAEKLKNYQCNINVIPLNPVPEFTYKPPSEKKIEAFCAVLKKAGLNVNLRRKKGSGINAACGQLRLEFGKRACSAGWHGGATRPVDGSCLSVPSLIL